MSTSRAIKQLKSVWGKAGLDRIPTPDETMGNLQHPEPTPPRKRAKSARTARLTIRCTPEEKRRTELRAVAEGISINELYSRMQDLYEREHGALQLKAGGGMAHG